MAVHSDQTKQYTSELVKLTKKYPIAIGYQKLSVTGTAAALTVPAGASYALMTLESSLSTEAARYLETGGVPTSTDGMVLYNLDRVTVLGYQNLINFQIIRIAAGTHTLHIQYYR